MDYLDDFDRYQDLVFQAKLTGKSGSSPIKYEWEELQNAEDGTLVSVTGGRVGTSTNGWAVEINNVDVDVTGEPTVWMTLRGMQSGQPVFEFVYNGPMGGGYTHTASFTSGDPPFCNMYTTAYTVSTGTWADTAALDSLIYFPSDHRQAGGYWLPVTPTTRMASQYVDDADPDPSAGKRYIRTTNRPTINSVAFVSEVGFMEFTGADLCGIAFYDYDTSSYFVLDTDASGRHVLSLRAAGVGVGGVVVDGEQFFGGGGKVFRDTLNVEGQGGPSDPGAEVTTSYLLFGADRLAPGGYISDFDGGPFMIRANVGGVGGGIAVKDDGVHLLQYTDNAGTIGTTALQVYEAYPSYSYFSGSTGTVSGLSFVAGVYTGGAVDPGSLDGGTW